MQYTPANRIQSVRGSAIREMFKKMADPSIISMAGGNPSPDLFPNEELAAIAADLLKNNKVLALQYGVTEGYTPLREKIADMLRTRENIGNEEDMLITVSGGQQAIDLTARVLLNEGDGVIVEEPSFVGAMNSFRSYGAKLYGVPMEDDGMNMDILRQTIASHKNIKLIYTIPSFQNPTGITMSVEKRKALYACAKENGILIIEDNPYGELSYTGKKLPAIKSFDTDGVVVYCGSFSKILAPGLRLGYMMGHRDFINRAVIMKQANDVHTAMLPQLLAYRFITQYSLDSYIEKIRALYSHKCALMLSEIDAHFPKNVRHTVPTGGIFLWCTLPDGYDASRLAALCLEKKVAIVSGNTFSPDPDLPSPGFRLNFSTASDENIKEGIRRIAEALRELLDK